MKTANGSHLKSDYQTQFCIYPVFFVSIGLSTRQRVVVFMVLSKPCYVRYIGIRHFRSFQLRNVENHCFKELPLVYWKLIIVCLYVWNELEKYRDAEILICHSDRFDSRSQDDEIVSNCKFATSRCKATTTTSCNNVFLSVQIHKWNFVALKMLVCFCLENVLIKNWNKIQSGPRKTFRKALSVW